MFEQFINLYPYEPGYNRLRQSSGKVASCSMHVRENGQKTCDCVFCGVLILIPSSLNKRGDTTMIWRECRTNHQGKPHCDCGKYHKNYLIGHAKGECELSCNNSVKMKKIDTAKRVASPVTTHGQCATKMCEMCDEVAEYVQGL
jgi:hypothetical protein